MERIDLGPKSRVIGNVQYELIGMAIGAAVNGTLIADSDGAALDAGERCRSIR
jgi:cytoskeletal protein CcmA (bactofilin family)